MVSFYLQLGILGGFLLVSVKNVIRKGKNRRFDSFLFIFYDGGNIVILLYKCMNGTSLWKYVEVHV